MKIINQVLNNKQLMRYFISAVIIVCIELISFQLIFLSSKNYQFATVLSFAIGVVLNWICSRIFVFGASDHHPAKEFAMVLVASLGGILIQLAIVSFSVDILKFYPIIGKIFSIFFSFFWNYWFRAHFIFKKI